MRIWSSLGEKNLNNSQRSPHNACIEETTHIKVPRNHHGIWKQTTMFGHKRKPAQLRFNYLTNNINSICNMPDFSTFLWNDTLLILTTAYKRGSNYLHLKRRKLDTKKWSYIANAETIMQLRLQCYLPNSRRAEDFVVEAHSHCHPQPDCTKSNTGCWPGRI